MMRRFQHTLWAASLILSTATWASAPIVVGSTFAIAERNFMTVLTERLSQPETRAKWISMQNAGKNNAKAYGRQPANVHLPRATHSQQFEFDPTFTVLHNITDTTGDILIKAGTRVNPLATVPLDAPLIFFNADDVKQVGFVKKVLKDYDNKLTLIVTDGDIINAQAALSLPIFADQKGRLTTKLGITQVPAVVTQDGLQLRIEEVAL